MLEAELLAELDVRQTARKDLGWGSTTDWFTHLAGTTRRQGRRTVEHARLLPPASHGARLRVAVTLTADTLTRATAGAGVTEDGLVLPAAVVRRLACDADLVPVVLDEQGGVLDVGRTRRLVTPAIWTALVVRDRHCAFPGCTRPPVMSHTHHIRHWAEGGPTALDNLASC